MVLHWRRGHPLGSFCCGFFQRLLSPSWSSSSSAQAWGFRTVRFCTCHWLLWCVYGTVTAVDFTFLREWKEGEVGRKGEDWFLSLTFVKSCWTYTCSLKPSLLTFFPLADQWKRMSKVLRSAGHDLVPVKENLIDTIWTDCPQRPCKPLITLDLNYTGEELNSQ